MKKAVLLSLMGVFIVACAFKMSRDAGFSQTKIVASPSLADIHSQKIQPLFDAKCIACHSCYNSPCQLNLTSYEGVLRGANKDNLYDFSKFTNRKPTRLYVDGDSLKDWEKLGFFSVLGDKPHNLLEHMITLPYGVESGRQKAYESEYSRTCVASTEEEEFKKFTELNPAGRMPLGFPPLSEKEVVTIKDWIKKGAPGPKLETLEAEFIRPIKSEVKKWEDFLNQKGLKERIVARYLYEHLFLASLFFESSPEISLRVVRSETRTGKIKEIGTHFPFSKIDRLFYYRLRPVTNTIVHKSHIPFSLNDKKLQKYKRDFIRGQWEYEPQNMPPYGDEGSNPFKTFASMPKKARYQLFLENAGYFIMTFIKGPVCRGQTALNVINDHFWVLFLDPDYDPLLQSEETYKKVASLTKFPSRLDGDLKPLVNFKKSYWKSVEEKFSYLQKKVLSKEALWKGNNDPDANITVYRHYDSATVLQGLRGRIPKTIWVLDYQVFENIYYNLSAGYNVFGPILHQINSRLYMEVSRVAAEDLFISFLPKEIRLPTRKRWNIPTPNLKESLLKSLSDVLTKDVQEKLTKDYPYKGGLIETEEKISSKEEFLKELMSYYSPEQSKRKNLQIEGHGPFDVIKSLPSKVAQHFPEATFLLIEEESEKKLWTLLHNRDHYNVGMMFFEEDRLRPERDTLDVIKGVASSYANLIISLKRNQIESFVSDLTSAQTKTDVENTLIKFGVLRNDPRFWEIYNQVSSMTLNPQTNERGYIDLNRYHNYLLKP